LAALAAAAVAIMPCGTEKGITPLARLPKGYAEVAQAELPGLLVGRALWDEVMSPPNVFDANFVIAFYSESRTRLRGGRVETSGAYRFAKGEVCLTSYNDGECFHLYRDPSGALLRSVGKGKGYTPVYWMPSPETLPPSRPVFPKGCRPGS
jgi:hypothetical protein